MTEIKYAGQNGFIITKNGLTLSFDLYLSDCVFRLSGRGKRNYTSPVSEDTLKEIDFYFISHDHLDHLDPDTISLVAKLNHKVKFICPYPYIDKMISLGADRESIIGAKAFEALSLSEKLTVTPVPEKHEEYILVDGNHGALGYVVDFNGFKFYHAGDCIADKTLADELLKMGPFDVMFLPINGHDWKRFNDDLMGNMTYREALDLAAYVKTNMVVPMHYDLFNNNTENPAFFVDYLYRAYPTQKFKMFMPGETVIFKDRA